MEVFDIAAAIEGLQAALTVHSTRLCFSVSEEEGDESRRGGRRELVESLLDPVARYLDEDLEEEEQDAGPAMHRTAKARTIHRLPQDLTAVLLGCLRDSGGDAHKEARDPQSHTEDAMSRGQRRAASLLLEVLKM